MVLFASISYNHFLKLIIAIKTMTDLTEKELAFIDRVKPHLENYLRLLKKKGVEPGAGSYVLSENGNVYHGVPFGAARTIHGEENAIGTMLTEESVKALFRVLLVVGGPQEMIMPCGMCRVAIKRYGVEGASVLCSNLDLSEIRKFTISELYPYPYEGELELCKL